MKLMTIDRRLGVRLGPALAVAALLGGCAAPAPPARLLQMRAATPAVAPAVVNQGVWLLVLPLRLPDYLDRDAILVPSGQAGLTSLPGYRWAEPLRESVPRLLRNDLATLLGEARVWSSPLPPGVLAQRQLRVEVLSFGSSSDQRTVQLSARWSVVDVAGSTPARAEKAELSVDVAGSDADSLVAAHRLALWQLAQRVARP